MRALYGWCGDCGKSLRVCEGHEDAAKHGVTVEDELIAAERMTTEQPAVDAEIFKLRMNKTIGKVIAREREAIRDARALEAEEREARDWRANVERWET